MRIVLDCSTKRADIDIVISRGEIETGSSAQCDVAAAGCIVIERIKTVGRVEAAGSVAPEGVKSGGRVGAAGSVALERTNTVGRVVGSVCVRNERQSTVGRIEVAGGVA
jgi:hypothetical protein